MTMRHMLAVALVMFAQGCSMNSGLIIKNSTRASICIQTQIESVVVDPGLDSRRVAIGNASSFSINESSEGRVMQYELPRPFGHLAERRKVSFQTLYLDLDESDAIYVRDSTDHHRIVPQPQRFPIKPASIRN